MTSRRRPASRPRAAAATGAGVTAATVTPATALAAVPAGLRDPLLAALNEIATNFRLRKWEPSELNGGKLCEAAYSILRSHVDGTWAKKPTKPRDMVAACREFEKADKATYPQSVRITTPRLLMALYEIRNNRGVGHAGSDVDPNHMDATLVLTGAKWIVAELVRIFHDVDTTVATQVVDALVERVVPGVWTDGVVRRVLDPKMRMKDQTLLHLYGSSTPISEADLVAWTEHSNPSVFRRDVLVTAHKARLIEYNRAERTARILPPGEAYVEKNLADHL